MESNNTQLNISAFTELKKQEIYLTGSGDLHKLDICSQSIARWGQYCQYHYYALLDVATEENLRRASLYEFCRPGENVIVRHIYEAHITAFIQSLHALIDSFPYLLNLFHTTIENFENTQVSWRDTFLIRYKDYPFFDELKCFVQELRFNQIKGYCNTIKHKYLVRVSNNETYLEFENFNFKRAIEVANNKFNYLDEEVKNQNVVTFIKDCHNELIPKFFELCQSIINYKEVELSNKKTISTKTYCS